MLPECSPSAAADHESRVMNLKLKSHGPQGAERMSGELQIEHDMLSSKPGNRLQRAWRWLKTPG